jgi:hypothetical protein
VAALHNRVKQLATWQQVFVGLLNSITG